MLILPFHSLTRAGPSPVDPVCPVVWYPSEQHVLSAGLSGAHPDVLRLPSQIR